MMEYNNDERLGHQKMIGIQHDEQVHNYKYITK